MKVSPTMQLVERAFPIGSNLLYYVLVRRGEMNQPPVVMLSVERRISRAGHRDSSLDAQNDKRVLSIPMQAHQHL